MMSFFSALTLLFFSVGLILSVPSVVNLIQTEVLAENIPQPSPKPAVEAKKAKIPLQTDNLIPPPPLSATSALIVDLDSNSVLFTKDAQKKVPIASTTKIMTAFLAVSFFKPNDLLVVPQGLNIEGSSMGLKEGEEITFRSLLYGMLLNSGNDAAYTVAANFPGGITAFVEKMNDQAKSLGLLNTHFDNPAGFDGPNHYSSAEDLAKIAAKASENGQLARIFGTKETTVISKDKTVIHPLKNLNKLLSTPGVLGIKTGTTPQAKENLVGLVERDKHKILTVVLGSNDRFGETQNLIEWVYTNFIWK